MGVGESEGGVWGCERVRGVGESEGVYGGGRESEGGVWGGRE